MRETGLNPTRSSAKCLTTQAGLNLFSFHAKLSRLTIFSSLFESSLPLNRSERTIPLKLPFPLSHHFLSFFQRRHTFSPTRPPSPLSYSLLQAIFFRFLSSRESQRPFFTLSFESEIGARLESCSSERLRIQRGHIVISLRLGITSSPLWG